MSTPPTVTIGGTDLTDYLQEKSLSVKLNSADVSLIAPSDTPVVGDTFVVTDPTWSGTVVQVATVGYKGDVPFLKVRASNIDTLPDLGAAPFDLSDASPPANYADLEVTVTRNGAVDETRATCKVYTDGLLPGQEIAITSTVEGLSATTFTIRDLTVEWSRPDAAVYTLQMALGDFATSSTSGPDGGPTNPIHLRGVIGHIGGGGGGGGGVFGDTYGIVYEANSFSSASGPADIVFDTMYDPNDPFAVVVSPSSNLGLTLAGSGTQITATTDGTWAFWVYVHHTNSPGFIKVGHPQFGPNVIYAMPSNIYQSELNDLLVISMKSGEDVIFSQNNNVAASVADYMSVTVTRMGTFHP